MLTNASIPHIWTSTSLSLQAARTDLICKYFMRSYYPSCHDAEGIGCMLWLYNPAAKPTLCSIDGLIHGLEMPAQVMHIDYRPDSLPPNSAAPARGRLLTFSSFTQTD